MAVMTLGERFEKLSANEIEIRLRLLFNIVKIQLSLSILFGLITTVVLITVGGESAFVVLGPALVSILIQILSYFYVRQRQTVLGTWLLIFSILAVVPFLSLAIKADGLHNLLYMWPLILSAMILDSVSTLIVGAIIALITIIPLLVQVTFKVWNPLLTADPALVNSFELLATLAALVMITLGTIVMANTLNSTARRAENEANKLKLANQEVGQREQQGQEVGQQIKQLANFLSAASRQQASGAQEQVAAVVEVTTSLEELSETARQIAVNAESVAKAAGDALGIASRLRDSSSQAGDTSERGQQAVESAIKAIEVVRNRIELLGQRLLNLTERSKQIGTIIDLISEIADETHLLALNAAIESAGVGEAGRRFGVIAQEVKSLADRSLEATQDVRQIIVELQGAVAAAVLAAEEGKKETGRAVERSYQAGIVINEMGQVVNETSGEARQIVEAVQSVNTLCEEISFATRQQQSASAQIVTTMRAISEIAQETADGSRETIDSMEELQRLSRELNKTVAN
jgi:methyl-accepting chemotaxis protein